jgi:hypothetical protein
MLLQKVDDRAYVRNKIDWMYKQASIANPANRLGLAKAMGLVCWILTLISFFFSRRG